MTIKSIIKSIAEAAEYTYDIITMPINKARVQRTEAALRNVAAYNHNPVALEVTDKRGRITYKVIDDNPIALTTTAGEIAKIEERDGYTARPVNIRVAMYNSRALVRQYC